MSTRTAYVLKCTCGECGPDYLHRAERPEGRHVTWPLLGVFDFSPADPVTFETAQIAEGVRTLCALADPTLRQRLVVEPWPMPDDQVPGRLIGREHYH